ncbi:MAG: hypothetical protein PUE71_10720 [Clostridia bacterium]|nr:hypothetical protein [Clostridia bacterium]
MLGETMDFLSILIVTAIAVWFIYAIRYMIKNKGTCACGGSKGCNNCGAKTDKDEQCNHDCAHCQECKNMK